MSYDWGPHYIMPTSVAMRYSGIVRLREQLDDDLLGKELEALGIRGTVQRVNNPWYFRRKGSTTWILIGESDDRAENFPVTWNTRELENGDYEVLGLMHVYVKEGGNVRVIARQNVVGVTVEN